MNSQDLDLNSLQLAGFDLPLSLAVIAGVAVVYTLYLALSPLLEEGEISTEEWSRMEDESLALLNRRDRVIAELKDLEFEAAMNKIDDQDLSRLRGQYEREALRLIEALDQQASNYAQEIDSEVNATREAARSRRAAKRASAESDSAEVVSRETDSVKMASKETDTEQRNESTSVEEPAHV